MCVSFPGLTVSTARLTVACYSTSQIVTLLNLQTLPVTQLWSSQIQQMLRAPSVLGLRSTEGLMENLPYVLGWKFSVEMVA
jgi:hypothetical protein